MKMILILGVMAVICYSIWPDLKKNYVDVRDIPEYNWRSQPKYSIPGMKKTGTPPKANVQSKPESTAFVPSEPIALIKQVSRKYGVPGGALYGIWSKESNRRLYGYGESNDWPLVSDLVKPDGKCVREYGQAKCDKHLRSLKAICSQTRHDGSKVCDPEKVRTSYALAMGPMQHMPAEIITFDGNGQARWSARAVDYDRDGVVDPHDLDDSMAMSALFLKKYHSELGTWQKAVNRYYGSQKEGYMEGTTAGRKGVVDYWRDWCSSFERCDDRRQALAMNE